jgi:hypothetical protein
LTENYYFNYYLQSLNQSMRVEKLPDCLIGETYLDAVKIIYAGSIDYKTRIRSCMSRSQDKELDKYLRKAYKTEEKNQLSEVLMMGLLSLHNVLDFQDTGEENNMNPSTNIKHNNFKIKLPTPKS